VKILPLPVYAAHPHSFSQIFKANKASQKILFFSREGIVISPRIEPVLVTVSLQVMVIMEREEPLDAAVHFRDTRI